MDQLIFNESPKVTFGSNHYINVPTILQYDDTPLVEVIRNSRVDITTEISIYHTDGTYLAKANGSRLFLTEDGKKCDLKLSHPIDATVCELDGRTLFELKRIGPAAFAITAELYTPNGRFISVKDSGPKIFSEINKDITVIGGITMIGNTFSGCRIGVWIKSNGSVSIGVS